MSFQTAHNLDFMVADDPKGFARAQWALAIGITHCDDEHPHIPWRLFQVGTCHGQWRAVPGAYEILSVMNDEPGNGHFEDVLQWFEQSCRRDGKVLRIRSVDNKKFKKHLIRKRGFQPDRTTETNDVVKRFEYLPPRLQ